MNLPIRCQCGAVTGNVRTGGVACRGSCYCRDCQAYARFLGDAERILDAQGGTEVIGTLPHRVRFTSGVEQLACVTLTDKGPYRWYAACCRSPIGNTTRAPRAAYLGLLRVALAATPEEIDRAFGKPRFAFSPESATGKVASTPLAVFGAVWSVVINMLSSLVSGSWRTSPFFKPGGAEPLQAPHAVTPEERRRLRGD